MTLTLSLTKKRFLHKEKKPIPPGVPDVGEGPDPHHCCLPSGQVAPAGGQKEAGDRVPGIIIVIMIIIIMMTEDINNVNRTVVMTHLWPT